MPGQRRLSNLKMRRGPGYAAELGDADEVVKAAQFHAAISLLPCAEVNPILGGAMPNGIAMIGKRYLHDGRD